MNSPGSKIRLIKAAGVKTLHRAGWVMMDPYQVIENGCIEVERGWITGVFKAGRGQKAPNPGDSGPGIIDHGPGVLLAPLVNAHLHLELSALRNTLSFDKGFTAWVQALLEKREAMGNAVLTREAQKAAESLAALGIGYVGEISTLGLTRTLVQSQGLAGVWFQEILGAIGSTAELVKADLLSFSLAGHAPHTTDPFLLQAVKKTTRARGLPFSIHLAESDEESEFIRGTPGGARGQWGEFLASRGIDTTLWPLGSKLDAKSPVQYLDDLGILDASTLAVHLLNINGPDLDILARTKTRICLCPRSNWMLHKKLPNIQGFLDKKLAPALGTDSLASSPSLSLLDEMAFVRQKFPHIDPAQVLSMATLNGARALGLDHLAGTLDKGKKSTFIYVDLTVPTLSDLMEKLTTLET